MDASTHAADMTLLKRMMIFMTIFAFVVRLWLLFIVDQKVTPSAFPAQGVVHYIESHHHYREIGLQTKRAYSAAAFLGFCTTQSTISPCRLFWLLENLFVLRNPFTGVLLLYFCPYTCMPPSIGILVATQ